MSIRIAINGYGRIGRCILRALYESGFRRKLQIVAINELSSLSSLIHLTRFDSTHGRFSGTVEEVEGGIRVNGDEIAVFSHRNIDDLDWESLDVDIVFECSGRYCERSTAQQHINRGASRVIFSSPATREVDATIVYGFNEHTLRKAHTIISNASCTTNCSAHIIDLLDNHFGIEQGHITIVHSSMNDQPVIDAYHNPDLRKSRSSSTSIIPVSTGLALGIERLFPHLSGRFEAVSLRVPTTNVSLMQLNVNVSEKASRSGVNNLIKEKANGVLAGVLEYTELPLVSCDFNHNPSSAIIDGSQTLVARQRLVTVIAWFDNEWGYSNRMLNTAIALMEAEC
ncbi:MAG TPA: glyceraldehyde 3-phosphate dehydrogenase NAD-binding domain-containing protein [Desulfopila sp.]|nr:glyceraldehyde 3-phosphate dehydrogenase NAD-binding domain-containing protein [Desulfopila sp.]